MRTTLLFISTLLLTSPLYALLTDGGDYAIKTTYRDGYYFFARCHYKAQSAMTAQRLSACRPLNTEGLRSQDFELLQQRLQTKADHATHSAALWQKIRWGLLALTTTSVLLTVRKLHQEKVIQMLGKSAACNHHHHHGLWQRITAYLPHFSITKAGRFFFREQQWRAPTLSAQILAIVVAGQKSQTDLDKKTLYEFLQTEILQLSIAQNDAPVINVRSVTAIEFMLYEVMRLQQAGLEEQTADS